MASVHLPVYHPCPGFRGVGLHQETVSTALSSNPVCAESPAESKSPKFKPHIF